jgi:hypothetical protein
MNSFKSACRCDQQGEHAMARKRKSNKLFNNRFVSLEDNDFDYYDYHNDQNSSYRSLDEKGARDEELNSDERSKSQTGLWTWLRGS